MIRRVISAMTGQAKIRCLFDEGLLDRIPAGAATRLQVAAFIQIKPCAAFLQRARATRTLPG
jgi:hypothetical protein